MAKTGHAVATKDRAGQDHAGEALVDQIANAGEVALSPSALPDESGKRSLDNVPERVRNDILAHDQRAEVLIRMVQLGGLAMFAVLYAIAPKTSAGTDFAPMPYAFGAYFLFAGFGLWWALKQRIPDIGVYFLTAVDIALLMVLIWSFHIQYEQPPSFYLKAPTLFHIFAFIALRALRFEPRFIIATGLFAALGWGLMLAYAVFAAPDGMMVTRNYITYLTENAILIGAEFDKIIAILSVTAILAYAVTRARNLLIDAVTGQTAARDLSRFFDSGVAAQIQSSETTLTAGEGVTREAAVLNIDIRGFSKLAASIEADQVMAILSAYQQRLVPIIQAHGGTIDKFMGDGIMATFGASAPSETYAADALRATDALEAEISEWAAANSAKGDFDPLRVNLAVATGPVVFGAVGTGDRLELTVIGSAVNLSAKLEKFNKEAGSRALATEEAVKLARQQGYQTPLPNKPRKGRIEGVRSAVQYRVLH
jgi:adenylate cyclase